MEENEFQYLFLYFNILLISIIVIIHNFVFKYLE